VVSGLVDFDDISYDDHADLLYNLAQQTVEHFRSYLSEEDIPKVLRCHQKAIAKLIHIQMQNHYWEEASGYDVVVSKGFDELKECAYSALENIPTQDFRQPIEERSRVPQMIFSGFQRCLYPVLKFQSDTERRLAVIVDRESIKWFKPMRGQFQLFYKLDGELPEYQPDFIAETADCIYMIEAKAENQMKDPIVLAKKEIAVRYCKQATDHAEKHGAKPWKYMLVPHDVISDNMTLSGLSSQFS
jgi:type III restriction enzyme